MSKKNYTKFSEKSENEIVIETVPTMEPEAEPEVTEPVTEPEVTDLEVTKIDILPVGKVVNCKKLNVRKEPKKDSEVLCVINNNEEVILDVEEEATYKDFYKIVTSNGVKGYCVKDFIEVK